MGMLKRIRKLETDVSSVRRSEKFGRNISNASKEKTEEEIFWYSTESNIEKYDVVKIVDDGVSKWDYETDGEDNIGGIALFSALAEKQIKIKTSGICYAKVSSSSEEITLGDYLSPEEGSFVKTESSTIFRALESISNPSEINLVKVKIGSSGGGGESSPQPIIAKTTGVPTNGEYPVDFYANGKHEDSTGSGTCEVLMLNMSESLPTGTWIVCHPTATSVTGGS